jgi:hypothetical protein
LKCLICDSTAIRDLYFQNGYRIVRCAACGFGFVNPTPTPAELANYYAHGYAVPLERDAGNPARRMRRASPSLSAGSRSAAGCWRSAPHMVIR